MFRKLFLPLLTVLTLLGVIAYQAQHSPSNAADLDSTSFNIRPGDEVIHHLGHRKSWMVGRAFIKGKPAHAKCLHIEASTVGPRSVIPIAPDRAIDSAGPPLRQLLGREAKVAYASPAVAINKNIGVGSQLMPATIVIRRL